MEYLIARIMEIFEVEVLNDKPVNMIMKLVGIPDSPIDFRLTRK